MVENLINQQFCSDNFIRPYEIIRCKEKQVIDLSILYLTYSLALNEKSNLLSGNDKNRKITDHEGENLLSN